MSDSVRDRIAELEGWAKHLANGATPADGEDGFYWMKGGRMQWDHPIPDTLDEAANLPYGWGDWTFERAGDTFVFRVWKRTAPGEPTGPYVDATGTTELEARFALRLAVLEHIAKETP